VHTEVIEISLAELDRDIRDGQGAMVGCVTTGTGLISVTVTRPPSTVDLCVEEHVPDTDPEGLTDTVDAVIQHRRTVAGIDLDAAGTEGLLRLINRATQICAHLNAEAQTVHSPQRTVRDRADSAGRQAAGQDSATALNVAVANS
jgi:hypothetical protein